MSLASRRPRRHNVLMPKRYRDLLPQAAPSLPPPDLRPPSVSRSNTTVEMDTDSATHLEAGLSLRSRVSRIIRTPRNIFGLVRQYFGDQLPSVDPEEHITLADLSPSPSTEDSSQSRLRSKWWPFPNRNSFLLGSWYWNGGIQKSQSEFKDLINIVGDSSFDPDDVRPTKWSKVFATLGGGGPDDEAGEEWLDVDAGWRKKQVEITVPFHRRMQSPGTSQFVCAELYHRSLVEVIKERISDPHTAARFHLVPYDLLWQRSDQHREVRLHGEIYTSKAFREAHNTLQSSPPEPNCDLPRIIVALMFWSDATHLTQFGSSQLWPCYMAIGNESKYRRCKPSCNLCSHVAYFQKVSQQHAPNRSSVLIYLISYRMNSPTSQPSVSVEKVRKNLFSLIVVKSFFTPKLRFFLMMTFLRHGNMV